MVVFLVPGVGSVLLGLGAGGGRPENIPIVDKVSLFLLSSAFSQCILQVAYHY